MAKAKYRGLTDAQKHGGLDVWPGCGKLGRCMPCGRIHNFGVEKGDQWIDVFLCVENVHRGCPSPQPEPVHDWGPKGCRRCKALQPGVTKSPCRVSPYSR